MVPTPSVCSSVWAKQHGYSWGELGSYKTQMLSSNMQFPSNSIWVCGWPFIWLMLPVKVAIETLWTWHRIHLFSPQTILSIKRTLSIHPWLVVYGCPPWCSQVKVSRIPCEPPYVFILSLNPPLTSLPRQELNIVPLVFFSPIFILHEPLPCNWAPRTLLLLFF